MIHSKYNIAILKNESAYDHELWIKACEKKADLISFEIIDLTANDWCEKISSKNFDIFLLRPPGRTEYFKKLYDERTFLLTEVLQKKIYPSLEEIMIYENKRFLRDWLISNKIPHPKTYIFYNKEEALQFSSKQTNYPLVGKTNIGASGNGVQFLNSKTELIDYITLGFTVGINSKSGFKPKKGSIFLKIKKIFKKKNFIINRLKEYKASAEQVQKGFVILQEFIPHTYEWRCVRIGDSFFAHKKIARNNMSSGTLIKGYNDVPISLLNFIKSISEQAKLSSVAIDVFEHDNKFLVNEIQCFFGQSDPYQMLVNNKPGRYLFENEHWLFEEGNFNTNECYDLRLSEAITLINKPK